MAKNGGNTPWVGPWGCSKRRPPPLGSVALFWPTPSFWQGFRQSALGGHYLRAPLRDARPPPQGDAEKTEGLEVAAMFDRNKQGELALGQLRGATAQRSSGRISMRTGCAVGHPPPLRRGGCCLVIHGACPSNRPPKRGSFNACVTLREGRWTPRAGEFVPKNCLAFLAVFVNRCAPLPPPTLAFRIFLE